MSRIDALIGLQWGDEGKGKVVDRLSQSRGLVARYNGGANAGHTITTPDGTKFAVHQLPAGVATGTGLLLGRGMVLDLPALVKEIREAQRVFPGIGSVTVDPRVQVVLPTHQIADELREQDPSRRAGSTKRGIGPAYADRYARDGLTLAEVLYDVETAQEKIGFHAKRARPNLRASVRRNQAKSMWDAVRSAAVELGELARFQDGGVRIQEAMAAGHDVLLAGAHGFLLDIDHGTYPDVTSSGCGVGATGTLGIPPRAINRVLGVAKAYSTRIGTGAMPTEIEGEYLAGKIREAGREYGTTTGRPRRIGWLDLPALRYAVRVNGVDAIILTLVDVLGVVPDVWVCTGYEDELDIGCGDELDWSLPFPASVHKRVKPVMEKLGPVGATMEEIQAMRTRDELPTTLHHLVDLVQAFTGIAVTMLSVGPGRDQVVKLR